jgi:DNA-binding NarL/FixJ family response regulator
MSITVVVVDDEALVRGGFRALLAADPRFSVVGEAAHGVEAVRRCRETSPDVVLMDLRMPVMDGAEATRHLTAGPRLGTKVLVVTTFSDDHHVVTALRAGASGFILKDSPPERLLEAIEIVAAGNALLDPEITRTVIESAVRAHPRATSMPETITEREQGVLRLIAHGRSNAEIASELVLSVATVKTHVSHLLTKLGLRDRAQLVVFAYECGMVTPSASRPTGP